ncbi:hypothetical protein KUTeg_010932 [Tegillarca granosa]|uniref:Cytochrome P450 n=1 Tax=Tegillarca granosa TaxID=220873 RepID=A0ABQ9F6R8_TEGGR|nr:hypothetical protein KUTeg_010932 [Tegillarca granosa]
MYLLSCSVVDRFTLDAFAYSGFNYKVNSLKDENALLFQFMKAFNHSAAADNPIAGLASNLTPFLQIFDRRHKELHEQHLEKVRLVIKEERAKIAEGKGIEGNLLHQLISRSFNDRDEKGVLIQRYLNDEDIVGHLNALIGGGLGTTNAALAFEDPDVDAVRNMEYLDMVLEETLRLTPVAPGTARMCTDDCEINGVHFKKDMFVRIMCVTLYDDEEYFPHPDKFIPERFLKNESSKRNPFTFLPYGQGPRMCPGIKYAHLLVKIALVKILQRYRIDRCSKTIDPLPTALRPMLVPKDGVYVQLKRRF